MDFNLGVLDVKLLNAGFWKSSVKISFLELSFKLKDLRYRFEFQISGVLNFSPYPFRILALIFRFQKSGFNLKSSRICTFNSEIQNLIWKF